MGHRQGIADTRRPATVVPLKQLSNTHSDYATPVPLHAVAACPGQAADHTAPQNLTQLTRTDLHTT